MIKAFLLLFNSAPSWESIFRSRRSLLYVLMVQFCPLLLLFCLGEGFYLVHWGHTRGVVPRPHLFPVNETVVFEAAQFVLWLIVLFVDAAMIKAFGETFHGRHNYTETFTVVAYTLSPFFLLLLVGAFIPINHWVIFFIAMLFTLGTMYNGLPRIMKPDPPHAFGLYLMSAILVALTGGIAHELANWYLGGKFPKLQNIFVDWASHLPF
jgi:hypothetical protein